MSAPKYRVWDKRNSRFFLMELDYARFQTTNETRHLDGRTLLELNGEVHSDVHFYDHSGSKGLVFGYAGAEDLVWQQLVGLKDKNGKFIYEGDILSRYDGETILLVEYCEEYAKFGGMIYIQDGRAAENDCWMWFDELLAEKSEIVGNVFENKELLF